MTRAPVALDNSTFISAQEFIVSRNRGERSLDPFARQSYVELIQSLIFMPAVRVIHPTRLNPQPEHFGEEPYLLRRLLDRGLVSPVQVLTGSAQALADAEAAGLQLLRTQGVAALLAYHQSMDVVDRQVEASGNVGMRQRILQWNQFHESQMQHHMTRVQTADGIELDAMGEWTRAASMAVGELFRPLMPNAADPTTFIGALARSIRYQARANSANHLYQPHGCRRDYAVTLQLSSDEVDDALALDVVKLIRGIHTDVSSAAGPMRSRQLELVRLELPLVGGRLWSEEEAGIRPDKDWIDLVCDRIKSYRQQAAPIRELVAQIRTEEDVLRFERDIDDISQQLNERLGLSTADLTPLEKQLAEGVSSVASSVPGVPKVGGLWIGARTTLKRYAFRGSAAQKFIYQEYLNAWRRALD